MFDGSDLVHSYSRADAIRDGVLMDVSPTARKAGIRWPAARTCGAWEHCVGVPAGVARQDEAGRLWDVHGLFACAIRGSKAGARLIRFGVHVRNDNRERTPLVRHQALCGPGDHGEPVVPVVLPDEDGPGRGTEDGLAVMGRAAAPAPSLAPRAARSPGCPVPVSRSIAGFFICKLNPGMVISCLDINLFFDNSEDNPRKEPKGPQPGESALTGASAHPPHGGSEPGGRWANTQGPSRKGLRLILEGGQAEMRCALSRRTRGGWANTPFKSLWMRRIGRRASQRGMADQRPLKRGMSTATATAAGSRRGAWPIRGH